MISFERSIERAIEVSVEIASAVVAWFKLLTTNPAASSPTQGVTTFTRASAANYFDSAGVLRSAAVDTPRYQDGGLLIEQASTNLVKAANWRTAAMWIANATVVADQVGIDGVSNTACTVTDNSSTAAAFAMVSTPVLADNAEHTQTIFVKKNSAAQPIMIVTNLTGGTPKYPAFQFDSVTGAYVASPNITRSSVKSISATYWAISITMTNNGTNTTLVLAIHPSRRAAFGSADDVTLTGSVVIDYPQVELNRSSATSPMVGGTTRAADKCYTANANIPNLTSGAEFVWKGALPDDGSFHTAFRSSPNHTILYRVANGSIAVFIGGIFLGYTTGIDTAVHTYTLRTNGSNLHEFLIDGVVVKTSTTTGLLQPTTPLYIGSFNANVEFLNDSIQSFAMYGKALVAWFKLLTTDPAASSPTQGTTSFSRASSGTAVDANGLLVSYAADVPRQQDGGLLIEQGSTNLCRYSQNFAAWARQGMATVSVADTTVAPDGTLTADTLTFDPTSNSQMYQGGVITAAGTYTLSVWAKVATGTKQFRLVAWSTADGGKASIDFTATTTWQRVTFTITVTVATYIYITNNTAGTAGTLEVWGYQVETGSTATSYIKTLAAPVTRAADMCHTAAANIPTLANGATFVWKGALPNDGARHTAFRSSPNHIVIHRTLSGATNLWLGGVALGDVLSVDAAIHTYALRTNGSNLHELLIDGVVVKTSTATGMLQPTTPIYIGSWDGTANHLNDSTQSFTMYDTALTDAEIQGLG